MTQTTCDECGSRLAMGPDDGGAYLDLCDECGADLCSVCAAKFEVDGGYGEDGAQTRTHALCKGCAEDSK